MSDYYMVCREPGCEVRQRVANEIEGLAWFTKHYRDNHTDRTHVRIVEPVTE